MNRFLLALLLAATTILPQAAAQTKKHTKTPPKPETGTWNQIPVPPLPAFKPQVPKRIELSNGMVIFLQEDHELPLIDGTARIRGGARNEPVDKIGLVDIYSEVWRTGGTKAQTGDQLDDFLEVRAAKVETGGSSDSTTVSWSCLKGDFDDVFKVFADLLQNPEFRPDKIDIAQKEENDGISRRNDQVGEIAQRESVKLAYGADNPYARVPEYATVAAVTRQDLIDWHGKYVHPNNIILGVTGDFDSKAVEAKLRAAFESWPKGPAASQDTIQYTPTKPGYYLVPKDDVNQSSIHMVALGTTRDNPDYYAISVFNEAFGGGFSSRLFNDIRTKRGLAYSVGGGIGTNFGHPGIMQIAMGTKSESTIEAIQAAGQDIENLAKEPITDDEIQHAKDAILNAFIFRLDSPDKILAERMTYEYYGYPPDWLDKYQTEIKKVTKADVNRVAAKYMHRDKFAVLVVGNTKEFDKPLSSLGAVKDIDITIPSPTGSKEDDNAKPAASNPEGKALVAKVASAMGGLAKLQSVRTMHISIAESDAGAPPTPLDVTVVFPDKMHIDVQTPQGALTIVASPDASFMSMAGMGSRSMPPEQKTEMLSQLHHDLVYIAQHAEDPTFAFTAAGTEKIGDVDAAILDIGGAIPWVRWYVDPSNGRILREKYKAVGQQGPFEGESDLSDWRTVDGLTMPYIHKNKQNGQETSVGEFKKIDINPQVDPKLFEKPAEKSAQKQ
ncbi:MAG TPA: pitrilysin family protein [Candidatus Sulfotelmatobacter sp.]|jgi:zinc protease|nr:pitrilysin family protein [Candidatus Sulfotelmatobacter sp.]